MYHSVADERTRSFIDPRNHVSTGVFRRQMRLLKHRRRVLSMSELVERLGDGGPIPPRSVAFTFDDGYLDNLTVACETLDGLGLPATIYIPTRVVEHGLNQWVDRLYTILRWRTRSELEMEGTSCALGTPADSRATYLDLCARMIAMEDNAREAALRTIADQLKPSIEAPRLTLTWDELRGMVAGPFEIGAHTLGHTDLRTHEHDAQPEICASRDAIEHELGSAPRHFSFPYGRSCDHATRCVRDAGFVSAVDDSPERLITHTIDPFAMPRAQAPRSVRALALVTTGLPSAWAGLRAGGRRP